MVYGTVRGAHRVLPRVAATIVTTAVPSARSIHDSPQGLPVVAAVNGLWGDRIAARAPTLAIPMSIRLDGSDLVPTAGDVRAAVANPTPRLAVFVHGLCETDRSWMRPGPDPASPAASATYAEGLRSDLGYTPLLVRYNTGLHVSENGRALALLLERIVEAWPLGVQEVVLVGHSMGGLVARSACHYGDLDGSTWAPRVRHVVSLGTPHLGAPLEKATNVAGWALARWPESVPFARFLTARAAPGSKTCASEPSSTTTGKGTILTSSSATAVVRCRSCPTPTTTSSAPPSAGIQPVSPDGSWVISSSASRAPPAMADTAASRSRSTTATTSPA